MTAIIALDYRKVLSSVVAWLDAPTVLNKFDGLRLHYSHVTS